MTRVRGSIQGGAPMIPDYVDIAASERSFLAWARTGIAIIAPGFVIARFNLFRFAFAGFSGWLALG
jgi:uncharacterized membrane protein YidH (DUF202 family)